jgi:hypothetical protein
MIDFHLLQAWLNVTYRRVRRPLGDAGDVPGWVMVCVMTAGLVVVIFALFRARITTAIDSALDSVSNGTK